MSEQTNAPAASDAQQPTEPPVDPKAVKAAQKKAEAEAKKAEKAKADAEKKAKAEAEKAAREQAKLSKDTKNGITRPSRGVTLTVWQTADELSKQAGKPTDRASVVKALEGKVEVGTVHTQFGRWRKYYGLTETKEERQARLTKAREEKNAKSKAEREAKKAEKQAEKDAAKAKKEAEKAEKAKAGAVKAEAEAQAAQAATAQ